MRTLRTGLVLATALTTGLLALPAGAAHAATTPAAPTGGGVQPASLSSVSIQFHTNDEDKDADTFVKVDVYENNNRLAATIGSNLGHFDDNSDNGPYSLRTIDRTATSDSFPGGQVKICIRPNGHDTWRFDFVLLINVDGETIAVPGDLLQLSQNQRCDTRPI